MPICQFTPVESAAKPKRRIQRRDTAPTCRKTSSATIFSLQEALRGVIRKVMGEVARTGLPGNHHFFITFVTGAPGVRISSDCAKNIRSR